MNKIFALNKMWFVALMLMFAHVDTYAQSITISGEILGEKKDSVYVCFNNTRFDSRGYEVDENNRFSFSFNTEKSKIFIKVENDEILLQPGDSVFLLLQGDSIVGISGGNEILNQSLVNLQQSQSFLWKSAVKDSFAAFYNKLNQWNNAKIQQINACKYLNDNADRNIALSYLNFKLAAVSYGYLTRITGKKDSIQCAESMNSSDFLRLTAMRNFNDTVVGKSLPYNSALEFYLSFQMHIAYDENMSYLQNLWNHIKALNLPKPNNDVAYCLISLNLLQIGYAHYDHFFQDMDSLLNYFEMNANEKENADYLRNEFEMKYEYLRPGRQIADVELTDTLGNKYLLSSFKDKIIYVKMWSLSCKGCIQTIPEYNEVLANFTDTNVVFMSIAMDRDKYVEQWKTAIQKYDLKGLNFISEKGLYLGNHGLPKYYIIGKNNTIVNLCAPRPGSTELIPFLEELIKVESSNY